MAMPQPDYPKRVRAFQGFTDHQNKKQEIVFVIRSYFLKRILLALKNVGVDLREAVSFGANPGNPYQWKVVLNYLLSLGILEARPGDCLKLTPVGRIVLLARKSRARNSSASLRLALANEVALPTIVNLNLAGVLTDLLSNDGLSSERAIDHLPALSYLSQMGYVRYGKSYRATPLGTSIFKRVDALSIYGAYFRFLENLEELLTNPNASYGREMEGDVSGSGNSGRRKFFPQLEEFLRQLLKDNPQLGGLDIGAGNGTFFQWVTQEIPEMQGRFAAVEYDEHDSTTLQLCEQTLRSLGGNPLVFAGSAAEPDAILGRLERENFGPHWTSLWFIFQEAWQFVDDPIELLQRYRPLALNGLLIGEIFDVPWQVLAANCELTPHPELLFVHGISHQYVFTQQQWQEMFAEAGYKVWSEKRLDPIGDNDSYHCYGLWGVTPE